MKKYYKKWLAAILTAAVSLSGIGVPSFASEKAETPIVMEEDNSEILNENSPATGSAKSEGVSDGNAAIMEEGNNNSNKEESALENSSAAKNSDKEESASDNSSAAKENGQEEDGEDSLSDNGFSSNDETDKKGEVSDNSSDDGLSDNSVSDDSVPLAAEDEELVAEGAQQSPATALTLNEDKVKKLKGTVSEATINNVTDKFVTISYDGLEHSFDEFIDITNGNASDAFWVSITKGSSTTTVTDQVLNNKKFKDAADYGKVTIKPSESSSIQVSFYFTIKPCTVIVSSNSASRVYNSQPLSEHGYTVRKADGTEFSKVSGSNDEYALCGSDKLKIQNASYTKSITYPHESPSQNQFTYTPSFTSGNKDNYNLVTNYGLLEVVSSNFVRYCKTLNDLDTPDKVTAVMNNAGKVKLKWKKVKSYPKQDPNGLKRKTAYEVWRYSSDGSWTMLNRSYFGESYTEGAKPDKKACKTTFTDTTALQDATNNGAVLMYKIIAIGTDGGGIYGECSTPAYVQCRPFMTSATNGHSYEDLHLQFVDTKATGYELYHFDVTANKGKKKDERVSEEMTMAGSSLSYNTYTANKYKKFKSYGATVVDYFDEGTETVEIKDLFKGTGDTENAEEAQLKKKKEKPHSYQVKVRAEERYIYDEDRMYTVPASAWTALKTIKMGLGTAPSVTAHPNGLHDVYFTFTEVKNAKGYRIEVATSSNFADAQVKEVTAKKNTYKMFTKQKVQVYQMMSLEKDQLIPGQMFYCRVTALNKNNAPLDSIASVSKIVGECGRPYAVRNLTAEWNPSSEGTKGDAKLEWTDSKNTSTGIVGYKISRKAFSYNEKSKAYDIIDNAYTKVLLEASAKNKALTYANAPSSATDTEKTIPDGELIRYYISAVYQSSDTKYGENGLISGVESTIDYMNPSEIDFEKDTYKIGKGKGNSITMSIKYTPKTKYADNYNKQIRYEIADTAYTSYFKFETTDKGNHYTGKVTVEKALDKGETYTVKAISRGDGKVVAYAELLAIDGSTTGSSESGSSGSSGSSSGLKVCIDAGHGGSDAGATKSGVKEKDINLKLALLVGGYLEDKGATVYYTRTSDEYVSLTDRTDYAKEKGANLFVSIHCNSNSSKNTKGTEVYYSLVSAYAKKTLASKISSAVSSALGTSNRGAKTKQGDNGDYYSVIRTSAAKKIPGLIVEHGFLTNESDRSALTNDSTLDAVAKAEADAIYSNWK